MNIIDEKNFEQIKSKISEQLKKGDIYSKKPSDDMNTIEEQIDLLIDQDNRSDEVDNIFHKFPMTPIIKNQLSQLYHTGYLIVDDSSYPYDFSQIYNLISDIKNNTLSEKNIKPYTNKNSPLSGKNIFHTHHSCLNFPGNNASRLFEYKYGKDFVSFKKKIMQISQEMNTESVQCILKTLCNDIHIELLSLSESDYPKWRGLTGEWIIFQKKESENILLCFGNHKQGDNKIYEMIRNYL